MATKEEKSNKIEFKIPVFSVLKKGSVLKNIFLSGPGGEIREENENEAILIGRHPDCHITLDHPSISRFHLEIRAKPSVQQITVLDRSSVHGTWISGTKINSNVPVDLREGDLIKLGASTREYRLHWLSVNEAYEIENPLPPLLEEKEESHQDEIHQNDEHISSKSEKEYSSPVKSDSPLISQQIGSIKRGSSSILSRREKSKSVSSLTIQTGPIKENKEKCRVIFAKLGASLIEGDNEENFPSDKENVAKVRVEEEEENYKVSDENLDVSVIGGKNEDKFALDKETVSFVTEEENNRVLFAKLGASMIGGDNEEYFPSDEENVVNVRVEEEEENYKVSVENLGASVIGGNNEENFALGKETVSFVTEEEKNRVLFAKLGASLIGGDNEEYFPSDEENVVNVRVEEEEENYRVSVENLGASVIGGNNEENFALGKETVSFVTEEEKNRVLFAKLGASLIGGENEEYFPSEKEMTPQGSRGKTTKKNVKSVSILGEFSEMEYFVDEENKAPVSSAGRRINKGKSLCILGEIKQNSVVKENGNSSKSAKKSGKEKQNSISEVLLGNLDLNENEYFDSDKENLTPVSKSAKKSKRTVCILGELKEIGKSSLKGSKTKKMERGKKGEKSVCILGEMKQKIESPPSLPKFDTKENEENASYEEEALYGVQEENRESFMPENEIVNPARALFQNVDLDGAGDENAETFYSDKENCTPQSSRVACNLRQSFSEYHAKASPLRALFQNVDFKGAEEENSENLYFSPDKENCTPQSSRIARMSKQSFSKGCAEVEREMSKKKKELERMPLGVLFDNSVSATQDNNIVAFNQVEDKSREERKVWNMIVDTGCLVDEESIKALKLLQGLRGTRLIIPNIVIRELDCMKRRENLFTRSNKASKILKWIEECMERESGSWWIHVQSSSETAPVIPTPPVTPTSLIGLNNAGFGSNEGVFSPCGGYMEIVTPTSEDHVVDCALLFKKLRRTEEIVIVSTSTTLKIKAMAEGLLCEEAKEFRESLVNPFSKRFMWVSSSPRGATWSAIDDMAEIAENCNGYKCNNPVSARRTDAVKGLKLILHHNSSHYGMA